MDQMGDTGDVWVVLFSVEKQFGEVFRGRDWPSGCDNPLLSFYSGMRSIYRHVLDGTNAINDS